MECFLAKMHEGYPSQAGNESAMSASSSKKKEKSSGKASLDASAGLALDKEEQAILAQAHEQSPVNADKAKTLRKILNAQKKAGGDEAASAFKRPAAAAAAVVVAQKKPSASLGKQKMAEQATKEVHGMNFLRDFSMTIIIIPNSNSNNDNDNNNKNNQVAHHPQARVLIRNRP